MSTSNLLAAAAAAAAAAGNGDMGMAGVAGADLLGALGAHSHEKKPPNSIRGKWDGTKHKIIATELPNSELGLTNNVLKVSISTR